jgi:hypothetical protein
VIGTNLLAKLTCLHWLLEDFGVYVTTPISLFLDSTDAIRIAQDLVKHKLIKHTSVDASFVRTTVHDQILTL